MTVEVGITASLGGAAGHAGDVRQADFPAGSGRQHHGAERLDSLRRTQHTHRLLPPAHLRAPARRIDAGAAQGAVDLRGGQVEGLQARGVQGDVDLPVDASHPDYLADALLGDQAAGDGVVQQPAQFQVRHALSRYGVGNHGPAFDVEALDDGLLYSPRQAAADAVYGGAHVICDLLRIGADLEFDIGGGQPLGDGGLNMIDAGQVRGGGFHFPGNLRFDLAGRRARQHDMHLHQRE